MKTEPSLDKLSATYPLVFRLLADRELEVESNDILVAFECRHNSDVAKHEAVSTPVLHIHLDVLELSLSGFGDTGTWGDFFPLASIGDDEPELTVPRRPGGRAKYSIDIDDDDS